MADKMDRNEGRVWEMLQFVMGVLLIVTMALVGWITSQIADLKRNDAEHAAAISAITSSRFTSADAMEMAAAHAHDALETWQAIGELKTELGRKIDAIDVPPPSVLRMFEEHTRRLDRHSERLDGVVEKIDRMTTGDNE